MATAASLAKVNSFSLRELYECADPDFFLLAQEVVGNVIDLRTEAYGKANPGA